MVDTGKNHETGMKTARPAGDSPLDPADEIERLFGEFGRRGWLNPFAMEFPLQRGMHAPFEGKQPNVDLIDRDNELQVRAELPGVNRDDIEVTVSDRSVTISATTRYDQEDKDDKQYYRREISRGKFSRTLAMPTAIVEDRATASFADGILELNLPKQEEKPAHRTVEVK